MAMAKPYRFGGPLAGLRGWVLGVVLVAGCGPIEYISTVTFQATKAVDRARKAGAEGRAPYEYTMASQYLHKARDLAGYSRYQEAVAFGKSSLEWGRKAEAMCVEKSSRPVEKRDE